MVLTPDCFLGKEEAAVVEADAPWPHGTAISFIGHESLVMIQGAVAAAARHCPLPVTFNGETVERKAFLDGALHTERWRGLTFGVFRNRLTGYNTPDFNFHGLTLAVRLPTVDPIEGGTWSAHADIDACPELELVLPARKEAVESPFVDEMRNAARPRHLPRHGGRRPCAPRRMHRPQEGGRCRHRHARAARPSCAPGVPAPPISMTGVLRRRSPPSAPIRW